MSLVHSGSQEAVIPAVDFIDATVSPSNSRKEDLHSTFGSPIKMKQGVLADRQEPVGGEPLFAGATAYHGTPITPRTVLEAMGSRDYCVSFYRPDDVEWVDANARSWFADNGVFSFWMAALKSGGEVVMTRDYLDRYYAFVRRWVLEGTGACKWAVIPDPIGTGTQELDALLREWPADLADYGVPVFHLDEPIDRAVMLLEQYGRLCVGATGEYRVILSDAFSERMDDLFNAIHAGFGEILPVHMFRGLQLLKPEHSWPISSADSTDRARNHNRLKPLGDHYLWAVGQTADRWDRMAANRSLAWPVQRHPEMFGEAA